MKRLGCRETTFFFLPFVSNLITEKSKRSATFFFFVYFYFFFIFFHFYLRISKKSSTFAPAFENYVFQSKLTEGWVSG